MMRKILSLVLACLLALTGLAFATEEGEWVEILLLGEYGVANDGPVPTEAMMVLSVNFEANKMQIVEIDAGAEAEYNGAAATLADANVYGGAELAIATLNETYGLNVQDYIQISMADLIAVINLVGGVDLTITEAEMAYINEAELDTPVEAAGLVHLDGLQAVRHAINDADLEDEYACSRHASVLLAMGAALQNLDADAAMGLGDDILPLVRTSLETDEVKALVKTGLIVEIDSIEVARLLGRDMYVVVVEAEDASAAEVTVSGGSN